MLVLDEVQTPLEDVLTIQPQVVCYWDKDCLGQGTLYLSLRTVIWISDTSRKGLQLTYPAICVHATSSSCENFPNPCLFLVIDVKKTDIQYTPEVDVEDDGGVDEVDPMTATIRFIPADSFSVTQLYETMNECQAQNPELNDDMLDSSDADELDDNIGDDQNHFNEEAGQWYTAENLDREVQLSSEGRANLQRMIGNLGDVLDESGTLNFPRTNGHSNSQDVIEDN